MNRENMDFENQTYELATLFLADLEREGMNTPTVYSDDPLIDDGFDVHDGASEYLASLGNSTAAKCARPNAPVDTGLPSIFITPTKPRRFFAGAKANGQPVFSYQQQGAEQTEAELFCFAWYRRRSVRGRPMNHTLEYVKKHKVPLTRQSYLFFAYFGDPPADLGAEEEAEIPDLPSEGDIELPEGK
jgi:hypothetical protein